MYFQFFAARYFFSHMALGLPVDTLWLPLTSFYVMASASWILLLHLESCSLGHGVCVCVCAYAIILPAGILIYMFKFI